MSEAMNRLEQYLLSKDSQQKIEPLTPDASNREYFRIGWNDTTAIACVYPEPFSPEDLNYLDVTRLFTETNLPVAGIYEVEGEFGIVIQEDLGNQILREVLETALPEEREIFINRAINLIARIQTATPLAYDKNSIAAHLKFDEEKLFWELNFFKTHYFGSYRDEHLPEQIDHALTGEFTELARELETFARVLTHRDFHAANLMLDQGGQLRIIDHQDARIGSVAYDLVSLLLDRVLEKPEKRWLDEKKQLLLKEREDLGLERIDFEKFDYEFELVSVQRCLKAIGTFANQTANFDRTGYTRFINPMFLIVLEACERLNRFPFLQSSIKTQLERR